MIAVYHRGLFICRAKNHEELCDKLKHYSRLFTPLGLRY